MLKSVFFKDVRAGDVICVREGQYHTVAKVSGPFSQTYRKIVLRFDDGGFLDEPPDHIVGLKHRPLAVGVKHTDMMDVVLGCMRSLDDPPPSRMSRKDMVAREDRMFDELRDALEAYQLGLPPVAEEEAVA